MRSYDEPIRGEVRAAGFRRVSHGLYLTDRSGLDDDTEFRRDLRAWLEVLPEGAMFTHVTGARLRRWRLPALPEQTPVFAAVHGGKTHPRRQGLNCSRLIPAEDDRERRRAGDELPTDSPEEILLRCARDLGHLDLVVMLDSALAFGDVDRAKLERLLQSRRPGVRALRKAYEAADSRAESGGETVLRLFHHALEIDVEPQVDLCTEDGVFIGRADLLVVGTTDVHEYDGEVHREKSQHRADLRRERRFADTPYVRRGYTLDDLLNHPAVAMHEIDAALGRPHRAERLRRWRRVIDGSLYSGTGRARVMNRWRRHMGVVDWC
ncbi:MAG: hypothetical protein J2P22_03870 [Nocardioides sp.]|nr:hypothetical protein [Nocardioides sp.]